MQTILQLRLIVGFLGERGQFAWWPTAFYESSSRQFLEPVFSKTFHLAQYHGVVEAARLLHDEHLSVGSFHLFRLPEEIEEDLHALTLGNAGDSTLSELVSSKDAMGGLNSIARDSNVMGEGPTVVGKINELNTAKVIQGIASAYLSAFSKGRRSYPYLVR